MPANALGILFALTAAAVWGSGDFSGGLATRRHSPFQVLALSSLTGIVLLVGCALLWRETLPGAMSVLWSMLAGGAGAVGIAALYRALSMGQAATVAPITAVISAALPVFFGAVTEGLPAPQQMVGIVLAFGGIWLVSQPEQAEHAISQRGLFLAVLAGIGFGCFFILIAQVEDGKVFTPLVIARLVSLAAAALMLRLRGLSFVGPAANPVAIVAGVLDAGGNIFFLLAQQFTRLDIAAVLASLYPASTVILSALLLHERISRSQWIGVVICLGAIVLISL
ncbi:MAG: DMT family transporter [Caldilineaceae bacterium]